MTLRKYCILILLFLMSCKNDHTRFMENISSAIQKKDIGEYKDALKYIGYALRFDSSKSFAYVLKGQIEASLENDSSALLSFKKAIELNPQNTSGYFFKGLSYSTLDLDDSAIICFNKAIDTKKSIGHTYFEEVNDKHFALENQIDVPIYKIKYFRGLSYLYSSKYMEAINDLLYSISNGYETGRAQYYLGLTYARTGDREMACIYLRKAVENKNLDAKKMFMNYCDSGNVSNVLKR